MALVKSSKLSKTASKNTQAAVSVKRVIPPKARTRGKAHGHSSKISERIAAATEELASGLTEAAAAAEELRRSMEQIAAGADEASGASQEQLSAIQDISRNLAVARTEADSSRRRTEAVQVLLSETATQITASIRAIEKSADRQLGSGKIIAELERRAQDVSAITATVSKISDQTNLLALNAAIEAARAGDHGRGFAVVAEEVRALAETSDKSALEVQGLAEEITENVKSSVAVVAASASAAVAQAKAGTIVIQNLLTAREDMTELARGSQETLTAAIEAERAISEAQKGSELVAGAAEEQASASTEAQTAIRQQAQALEQGQSAAQNLAGLSEKLRVGSAGAVAVEQIASSAEELSATIQELSSAASQISAAVDQINKGAQQQAAAAQQSSAALAQIERSAHVAQEKSRVANERVSAIARVLTESRKSVEDLVLGVSEILERTRGSLFNIVQLEAVGRKIERIVESIMLVTVQTSMLAVSGSVEAARAGEAGRGFALVSNDVRSLAKDASDSVERVKDTVRSILDQITILRRDLEQIIAVAEVEIQNNQTVIAAIENLAGEVDLLGSGNRAILEGADAILSASEQTSLASKQIAAAAEEASSASRQAATASAQQAQGADDLAAAIEEIASLSDELKARND
jgi:methyl-accepting chemotaxis protein